MQFNCITVKLHCEAALALAPPPPLRLLFEVFPSAAAAPGEVLLVSLVPSWGYQTA
jgi:hypothetical protein